MFTPSRVAYLIVAICVLSASTALAFPADANWTPLIQNGIGLSDVAGDGSNQGRDIVGSGDDPAVYVASDAGSFYVRLRLNEVPTEADGTLRPFSWGLAIDTNGSLSDYEYLVMLDAMGGEIVLAKNTTPLGLGDPRDIANQLLFATPVMMGTNVRLISAASMFGASADVFLDFALPWTALSMEGLTRTQLVRHVAGTSNQRRSLTVDLAGTASAPGAGTLAQAACDPIPLGVVPLDSDADGLFDSTEDSNSNGMVDDGETDPLEADSDGDGLDDGVEDANHDGVRDPTETDPTDRDTDDGGVGDGVEVDAGTDPLDPSDDVPLPDEDGDGVPDATDNCIALANADQADGDNDGIGDPCEPDPLHVVGGGCSTTSSSGLLVPVLLLLLLRMRRWRLVAITLLSPLVSYADPTHFDTNRFRLATDHAAMLDVESARISRVAAWDLGVAFGVADDELVVEDPDGRRVGALVGRRVRASLVAAVGVTHWLQLGAELPFVLDQTGDDLMAVTAHRMDTRVVGDLRFAPKARLVRTSYVDLAVIAGVSIPTATSISYVGERGISFSPELVGSRQIGRIQISTNLGLRLRETVQLGDLRIGNEIYGRAGVGVKLDPNPGEVYLTTSIATAARDPFAHTNTNHWEALAGFGYAVGTSTTLFGAFGAGLDQGFGTPDWRLLAGVRFHHEPHRARVIVPPAPSPPLPRDRDGDQITDPDDACVFDAEDRDSIEDDDGCPDPDDDRDGIPDASDRCPRTAGIAALGGCPVDESSP